MAEQITIEEQEGIKVELANKKSIRAISRNTGISRPTIAKVRNNHCEEIQDIQKRLSSRFMELSETLVASIDEEVIKKAPLQARVLSASIALDKSRLISGQTTENIGIMGYFSAVTGSSNDDDYLLGQDVIEADV